MSKLSVRYKIIDILKTTKLLAPIYKGYKSKNNKNNFKIESLLFPNPIVDNSDEVRINLVLPTIRKTKVFAGINTALLIYKSLIRDELKFRIIIISFEKYDKKYTYNLGDNRIELVFLGENKNLPICKNDFFIYTSWRTSYVMKDVFKWQCNYFKLLNRKSLYLIQDFEPGFYPWSTEYYLADSTYRDMDNTIAIYNSKYLKEYFLNKGYHFYKDFAFDPILNNELKEILLRNSNSNIIRKKRILIYGRPNESRNAFELIKNSLLLWSKVYKDAINWEVISLGEGFKDIKLMNNTIKGVGKVSISEYAEYMLTSYVGISLMISPHPSYPPLEMSTFGVKTITNTFENKNLEGFNKNIISLTNSTPESILSALIQICDTFTESTQSIEVNDAYLNGNGLKDAAGFIYSCIDEMLTK